MLGPKRTIDEVFDPQENSLNAVRLVLASTVVFFHAWPLTGSGAAPTLLGTDLGGWAVASFFVISGFLITRSRTRRRTVQFFVDRFLRIYPAFIVCILFVAFVFAPLSLWLDSDSTWSVRNSVEYVVRNAALYPPAVQQPGIDSTLTDVPFSGTWNGALWTLFYEGVCYVAMGLLFVVVPAKRFALSCAVMTIALGMVLVSLWLIPGLAVPSAVSAMALWGFCFGVGASAYCFRQHIRVDTSATIIATALLVGASLLHVPVFPVLLAPLLLKVGASRFASQFASGRDISYGTYIYGFPLQQLFALTYDHFNFAPPLPVNVMVVLLTTWLVALVSWRFVEAPALALKRTSRASRRAQPLGVRKL